MKKLLLSALALALSHVTVTQAQSNDIPHLEKRDNRYALLSTVRQHSESSVPVDVLEQREELRTVVIPPGAWAVGRSVDEIRERGAAVAFTGIRRHGILGKAPEGAARLREGDLVLIYGRPEALEHAEGVLLAG